MVTAANGLCLLVLETICVSSASLASLSWSESTLEDCTNMQLVAGEEAQAAAPRPEGQDLHDHLRPCHALVRAQPR